MKKLLYLLILIVPMVSCNNHENNGHDKTVAANMERMKQFYEQVMNVHNPAMVDSFCTEDFTDLTPTPGFPADREGLKKAFVDFFAAFPDLKFTVNDVKGWGDTVMANFTMTGTNSGTFMGQPATNKQVTCDGVDFVIIKDLKATKHWGYMEEGKMMAQLGMGGSPPPADSSKAMGSEQPK